MSDHTDEQVQQSFGHMKAFDTADSLLGGADDILAAGFGAVGLYARPDRTPRGEIQALHSVGIKVWLLGEKGHPTGPEYFTPDQALRDAAVDVHFAASNHAPARTQIFRAVDYDAAESDLGRLTDYFTRYHAKVRSAGYLVSVYGSGLVCSAMIKAGVAHAGHLAQAKLWAEYKGFLHRAAIVQGESTTVLGRTVDQNEVRDMSVLW